MPGTARYSGGPACRWTTRSGPAAPPCCGEDLLVLVRDGMDAQYLAALDKHTGRAVWRTDRPPINTTRGDLKKCFSTPLLIREREGGAIDLNGSPVDRFL